MLASKKRIPLHVSLESFLSQMEGRFTVLPMNGEICARAYALPPKHFRDPADRVIVATALVKGLTLVTADAQIRNSRAVQTIW
jgi:PIN domain nuclease of toxin-antitoxin system